MGVLSYIPTQTHPVIICRVIGDVVDMNEPKSHNRTNRPRLSMGAENYLLSIFRLQEQKVRVTATQLAEHLKTLPSDEGLGTSLPSVGGMIRRMVREGLVEMASNKELILTSLGNKSAKSVVRRHRLAERMVVDILGLDLKDSHIEAHRLEHAISPLLEEKIVLLLGNPTTCPFGHPIPNSGYVENKGSISLTDAVSGKEWIIDKVPEDDQPLLEYLISKQLMPDHCVLVKEVSLSRGVITIICEKNEVVLGYDVAGKIQVYPL